MGDALKVKTLRGVIVAATPVVELRPGRLPFERTLNLPKDFSFRGSPEIRPALLRQLRGEVLRLAQPREVGGEHLLAITKIEIDGVVVVATRRIM